MNKCISVRLRSGLCMLLAVCLLLGAPVVALADGASCGQAAAEATVAEAARYCSNAKAIVDMVKEQLEDDTIAQVIDAAADNPEGLRSLGVSAIKSILTNGNYDNQIKKIGFDPTNDAQMELLANEVYDVAILYYKENEKNGAAAAEKASIQEVVRFALVQVGKYSEADAKTTAALYVKLNGMEQAEAIEYALANQKHNYVNGVCTGCGKEDENHLEPSQPETKPNEPETEPSQPATKPSQPETKPTEPETKPTEPETEPTMPEWSGSSTGSGILDIDWGGMIDRWFGDNDGQFEGPIDPDQVEVVVVSTAEKIYRGIKSLFEKYFPWSY